MGFAGSIDTNELSAQCNDVDRFSVDKLKLSTPKWIELTREAHPNRQIGPQKKTQKGTE